MLKNILTLFFSLWVLTACVAGQHLKMDHTPMEPEAVTARAGAVLVTVEDKRSYVLSREKKDYYIGHYRAGFGNVWDVTTYQKIPLKEQIKSDLSEELLNMGFVAPASGKKLLVSIIEWNFDGYQNGRFWYEIRVDVLNGSGDILTTSHLKDEVVIKGTVMSGAKGGFEREMPGQYNKIIDLIIRGNQKVLQAISQ